MSRNIFSCHSDIFGCYWQLLAQAGAAAKNPTMRRTALNNYLPKMSIGLCLRKPELEIKGKEKKIEVDHISSFSCTKLQSSHFTLSKS